MSCISSLNELDASALRIVYFMMTFLFAILLNIDKFTYLTKHLTIQWIIKDNYRHNDDILFYMFSHLL